MLHLVLSFDRVTPRLVSFFLSFSKYILTTQALLFLTHMQARESLGTVCDLVLK